MLAGEPRHHGRGLLFTRTLSRRPLRPDHCGHRAAERAGRGHGRPENPLLSPRRHPVVEPGVGRAPGGRSSATNPAGRFEPLDYAPDPPEEGKEEGKLPTQLFREEARSLISYNESPDVGFEASINPYRGCEHGCVY